MGMPHPVSLPPGFHWEMVGTGLELHAGGVRVLEVKRQRMGWVVRIDVPGRSQYARTLAVGSEVAGVRFGNKWARSHKDLRELGAPARTPATATDTAPAVVHRAPDPGDPVTAMPAYLEMIDKLDEIHALRGQLDTALERIELTLGEFMRGAGRLQDELDGDDATQGSGREAASEADEAQQREPLPA